MDKYVCMDGWLVIADLRSPRLDALYLNGWIDFGGASYTLARGLCLLSFHS
jgi:hypothetical protein